MRCAQPKKPSLKYTIKESSGVRIAPVSDKRPAVNAVAADYASVEISAASQHRCTDALITENRYDREVHQHEAPNGSPA